MAYENEVYLNSAHETCSELFLFPHICTPTRSLSAESRVVVDIIEERKLLSGEKENPRKTPLNENRFIMLDGPW
jgi:hypothetical protein